MKKTKTKKTNLFIISEIDNQNEKIKKIESELILETLYLLKLKINSKIRSMVEKLDESIWKNSTAIPKKI